MDRIENAVIASTMLGMNDHGMLDANVQLMYGAGGSQGFGGYRLDGRGGAAHPACSLFVSRVLAVAGVDSWEKLAGRPVRARIGENGLIEALGHFMEDKWFCPREEFKRFAGG